MLLTTCSAFILGVVHLTFAFGPRGSANLPVFMYLPLVGQGVACKYPPSPYHNSITRDASESDRFAPDSIYASSLWPTVQATVQQHEVGMAYGVVTAVQNGGLALFPLIVGSLRASLKAYAPGVEVFFSALAGVGVLTGFALYYTDKTMLGGKLEAAGECQVSLLPTACCLLLAPCALRLAACSTSPPCPYSPHLSLISRDLSERERLLVLHSQPMKRGESGSTGPWVGGGIREPLV